MMPDQQLQQYAAMHKNDPYIFPMAFAESNARKEARAAQQAQGMGQQQPKVVEQDLMAMAPENSGIGALAAPNMQRMADGGIAGYGDDGEFNYSGADDSVVMMAEGGIAHFQVGGSIESKYQQESIEMGEGRRMQYSPEVRAFVRAQEAASEASYPERERQRMLQGPYGPITPTPPTTAQPVGQTPSPRDDSFRRQTDPRMLGVPATALESNTPSPLPPKLAAPRPTAPAAPPPSAAAPEQNAAQRYAAMQKDMGLGDTQKIDAERMAYADSLRNVAADEKAAFERDTATRGKHGEAKETRLNARETGLGKEKEQMTGLALLEAGLGIMSTPGTLAQAIGKGAKEGLKSYGEGLAKLKLAQERIDDSRDSIEEFRRNEANMTATERRKFESQIGRTESEIKKLAVDAAKDMYGYKRDDAKAVFSADTQERLTEKEIQGRKDAARISASAPSSQERLYASLGKGNVKKGFDYYAAAMGPEAKGEQALLAKFAGPQGEIALKMLETTPEGKVTAQMIRQRLASAMLQRQNVANALP